MRQVAGFALAGVAFVLVFMAGCREEQTMYRADVLSNAPVAVEANEACYAAAIPHAVRLRAAGRASDRVSRSVLVRWAEAETTVRTTSPAVDSTDEIEPAEMLLLSETDLLEPEAVLLASSVSRRPAPAVADVMVSSVSHEARPARQPAVSTSTAWIDAHPASRPASLDGPELDVGRAEVVTPGQLTPAPVAEIMISYAPQIRRSVRKTYAANIHRRANDFRWVESAWVESPVVDNSIGNLAY